MRSHYLLPVLATLLIGAGPNAGAQETVEEAPGERRERIQNMTPEEREAMRERMQGRRQRDDQPRAF